MLARASDLQTPEYRLANKFSPVWRSPVGAAEGCEWRRVRQNTFAAFGSSYRKRVMYLVRKKGQSNVRHTGAHCLDCMP